VTDLYLPGLEPVVRSPEEIVLPALEEHKPVAVYALVSGGHDSAAVARWAVEALEGRFAGFLHIDTTIGVEETRDYVRRIAREWGVPLRVEAGQDYGSVVREFGFPGPGFHGLPYARLKERALRRVIAEAKVGHSRRSKVALAL
jgi:3'-phosphoadenosine 5'-phosphosulfate sulfotransferase (PAPS reductase)/FAD synthetase